MLSVFRGLGVCLTSAAGYCGVQTGTLGDVEFGELLCARGVDTDRIAQLGVREPAPEKKTMDDGCQKNTHEKV